VTWSSSVSVTGTLLVCRDVTDRGGLRWVVCLWASLNSLLSCCISSLCHHHHHTARSQTTILVSVCLSVTGVHTVVLCGRFTGRGTDWIGLCSVLRPLQHSIGYMGDCFYRSKDPTNSIKVLKEMLQKRKKTTQTTKYTHAQTITDTNGYIQNKQNKSPSLH